MSKRRKGRRGEKPFLTEALALFALVLARDVRIDDIVVKLTPTHIDQFTMRGEEKRRDEKRREEE